MQGFGGLYSEVTSAAGSRDPRSALMSYFDPIKSRVFEAINRDNDQGGTYLAFSGLKAGFRAYRRNRSSSYW